MVHGVDTDGCCEAKLLSEGVLLWETEDFFAASPDLFVSRMQAHELVDCTLMCLSLTTNESQAMARHLVNTGVHVHFVPALQCFFLMHIRVLWCDGVFFSYAPATVVYAHF